MAAWLRSSAGRVADALSELNDAVRRLESRYADRRICRRSLTQHSPGCRPSTIQDVWAAGVTYARSRVARQEEAVDGGDIYARVYHGRTPGTVLQGTRPVGRRAVGCRSASAATRPGMCPNRNWRWCINPALEIVGVTVGNDMSSRDIEGENPLYLPQAKIVYRLLRVWAGILLSRSGQAWPDASDSH